MALIATLGSAGQFPLGILAQLEFLVFVIIILISALFNWLKRKSEEAQEWAEAEEAEKARPQPRGAAPPPVSRPVERKTFDWEEELRRMLEGEKPTRPPTQPPPIIVSPSQEPPPQYTVVPPTTKPKAVPRKTTRTVVPSVHVAEPLPAPAVSLQPGNLRFDKQPYGLAKPSRRGRSAEAERAIAMFRSSATARQAVIASIILGPPKSLETEPERSV